MKKLLRKVLLFLLLTFLFVGSSPVSAQNVNNFSIRNYQIDYSLSKDSEGRSVLKTTETIVAEFPSYDQNHGIERAIPRSYDGHSVSLDVISVTNESGASLQYSTYDSNNNTVLRIGDPERYAHGRVAYKITYTQRDVTKYFKDTNSTEFYWDTNGTEWQVPIDQLSVSIAVDESLAKEMTNWNSCYVGGSGSREKCTFEQTGSLFQTKASNLKPGENITLSMGFNPKSFASYQPSASDVFWAAWAVLASLTFPIAIVLMIIISIRYYRRSNRVSEVGTIVPEYLPPKNVSVSVAASIVRNSANTFSAQLIDLAVRHYLKVYQTQEKAFLRAANFELEIVKDIKDLRAEEKEILKDIFDSTEVGSRLDMKKLKKNRSALLALSDNQKKLDTSIAGKYKLRAKNDLQSRWFKRAALFVFIAAIVTLSPWLASVALISLILSFTLKPLTDSGLQLYRYLKGLEMYIKVAEADRLKMLQSPEGAAKLDAPLDANDKRQLVKLYERVLPYAILFGQEKQWNAQLGKYYDSIHESPSWYHGHNAVFNAVVFSSAMHSFSQMTTYANASSSGTGGSGGGGFSGGGGGGGGGGGW